jgi:glycosyltransferase involved in cell wall biosynthesis
LPNLRVRDAASSVSLAELVSKRVNSNRSAVFVIDLVQDVNILRPLVFMATRDFGFEALLLVSGKFAARDVLGIWRSELEQMCGETGARLELFETGLDANRHLNGQGLLFTASESHLRNHSTTHDLLRHVPPTYLRVALQHGFECVGLRHSADHVRAHGETASFAADLVCAWTDCDQLASLAPSQRSKVVVTGPTSLLQMAPGKAQAKAGAPGIICENLHSVRFGGAAKAKTEFVDTFAEFARIMGKRKRRVALRPHVGGQYALNKQLRLPANVQVENAPLYRLDLRQFSYGISAPSSVVIDMLLAEIPTAVWRDSAGDMDASSYDGLNTVSSAHEWVQFAQAAERDRESILAEQSRFLKRQHMPLDPADVFARFAQIFRAAERMDVRPAGSVAERERLLFVANGNLPTLQLSFAKPLAPLIARGEIATQLVTEPQLKSLAGDENPAGIERYLDRYGPSAIVFCRYSGPAYEPILTWARRQQVPVIYHIDDDLLGVPLVIGERKFAFHNAPERRQAVTALLKAAEVVYASTEALKARLLGYFPGLNIVAGDIYCASRVVRHPSRDGTCRVGYMASADHAHNLEPVLPAIEQLLDRNPSVQFELFGSIPVPQNLARFGGRVVTTEAIAQYDAFLDAFASREWDVGICPLAPIDFNLAKADTKWVEYTAAGVAVVASRGTVYDACCADGCGILATTPEEWALALDLLVNNGDERLATVERAQAKLESRYTITRLRNQVLDVIAEGHGIARSRSQDNRQHKESSICQIQ